MPVVEVSKDFGGRLLTLQSGKLAKQTDASVLVRYGDSVVLVTVVSSKRFVADQAFFPLTVDFQEKYYSAGRVPGGFFKREAKPSDKATLSARLIDRPIRPLFPEDYTFDTHVVATVLSYDGANEPDLMASIGASAALHISDIPWQGPIASCRVGYVNGDYIVNIKPEELPNSSLELLVSGGRAGVVMVEGSAKELSEQVLVDAMFYAHENIQPILDMQEELREKIGKPKREYEKPVRNESLKGNLKAASGPGFKEAFAIREKLARYGALDELKKKIQEKFGKEKPETEEDKATNRLVALYFEELKAAFAREATVHNKKRIDGRRYNEIRDISCDVGLLPRVHGSALFTRGETQVLAAVTLGTADDEQKIDSISGVYQKTFLLHYNFPPFSVGEARPLRPPGRREVGHGVLAERAVSYIMPDKEKFPYTVRIVAEVLESNGSSSMATVCSSSLALMDAGVPTAKAVAGVAMGLIVEGDKVAVLSDILGDEDHLGDMDFKVCGTAEGVTAFQMDLKIGGVSRIIMEQALEQAKEGRLHVLGEMKKTLEVHRDTQSPYAPRIFTMKIKPAKVREVIGSGGKVIRGIIEETGVKIDIEDDGTIAIASVDEASARKAMDIIGKIVEEPEIGKEYEGRVTKIMDFGAFVEIIPGTEGLCHISELEHYRVRNVYDVVKEGDTIRVKCLDVDPMGKIRLSRRALLSKEESVPRESQGGEEENRESFGNRRPPLDDNRPMRGRDREGGGRDYRGGRDRDSGPRREGGGGRFGGPRREGGGGREPRYDRGGDRGERGGGDRYESRGRDRDRGGDRDDRGNRGGRGERQDRLERFDDRDERGRNDRTDREDRTRASNRDDDY